MKSQRLKKKNHGITLIELLIYLSVFSILSSFLLPYLKTTFVRVQLLTQQYALYHHLKNARYALMHHKKIFVCPSSTPYHCEKEWPTLGYRIFSLSENGESIEIQNKQLPFGMQAQFSGFGTDHWLIFSDGQALTTNGTFSLCIQNTCKYIVINKAGRAKLL